MTDRLSEYGDKRDFGRTPEPDSTGGDSATEGAPRFVVQEHDASSLHWDLRLEHEGALASWALPKGVPMHPDTNRLAVRTEDHPLAYIDFEGTIPQGEYGAGTIAVWDAGTYEPEKFRDDEVIAVLHGERVRGRYVLFRTKGKNWMIHRMDPPQDPGRSPAPGGLRPMMAIADDLPSEPDRFAYELKWDGVRAIVTVEGGRALAESRNGNDISPRYPELRAMAREIGATELVLDGELVAFDDEGRPSFERLQSRMHLGSDVAVRRAAKATPVIFAIFDLLWLDGHSTMSLPYSARRRLLAELDLTGPSWRTPAAHEDGATLLEASQSNGLEGIVAKRLDSAYEPGRRSRAWIKVKNRRGQELVVGGYTAGEGGRARSFGALLVGHYEADELRFAGAVGSGFSDALLADLRTRLAELRRADSPFVGRQPPRGASFVEPVLVAQVEFAEWTRSGTLRAPTFKGLRDDVDPASIVRE